MDTDLQRVKPYEGTEPYIFISYSHRDYERIDPILRHLKARGYRFWYDEGIDPGTEWPESIAGHLENSSVCLSFMSPYSAASKNCRREINFALSRNIPLLTVFLEDTKISPGLEMQISTYQSIMGFKYPDLPSLIDRIVSVDVTEPCRGTAESGAADGEIAEQAPSAERKKHILPLTAVLLIVAAAAAVFWFRSGSKPEEITENTVELNETVLPSVTSLPTHSPDTGEHGFPESYLQTKGNWKDHLWDESPITADEPLPEGYRVLISGEWGYGSLLIYGNEEGTIRFALTDDRIPDGFPMSQTAGINQPYWNVILPVNARESMQVIIEASDGIPSSFAELDTSLLLFEGNNYTVYSGFPYSLTDSTLLFEILLPEQFTTDDIKAAHVSLGTELKGYVDGYEFYN